MALVLVHNDVVINPAHAWDDVEGVHYHYPSKYQRKVITGEPFVYYRGVHRVGGKRGPAEYVGSGRIGAIWADPKTEAASRKAWYCAVEDYRRFPVAVPAKINGVNLEDIPANLWRDGVRALDPEVYQRIIGLAGEGGARAKPAQPVAGMVIQPSEDLIVPPMIGGGARSGASGYRKSKQAKQVGDWAEAIALDYLRRLPGARDHVHRAAVGETPGWDLDYLDAGGVLQRVEVKGTVGGAFTGVELTAGELRAAKAHGEGYWLCLVANCLTDRPKVQLIRNPAATLAAGTWTAAPMMYAVRFSAAAG